MRSITQIIPADGWLALYHDDSTAPLVAWGLIQDACRLNGGKVVGLVVGPGREPEIVPAGEVGRLKGYTRMER